MLVYYTDGSCSPNPGPGGFAVIQQNGNKLTPVKIGNEEESTNIRMEGRALIAAMQHADSVACTINTDSEFWINVLTKWAPGWEKKGWKKPRGEIKNLDLVKEAYSLYNESRAELVWVRAHVGTDGNETADEWANKARIGVVL